MSSIAGSNALRVGCSSDDSGSSRLRTTWWLTSAAVATAATWLTATTGRPTFAWIFAFVAIMCLYGSIDHLVEPALGDLVAPASAGESPSRLPADEIAELLDLDQATVRLDVERIAAAYAAGTLPASEDHTRSAA